MRLDATMALARTTDALGNKQNHETVHALFTQIEADRDIACYYQATDSIGVIIEASVQINTISLRLWETCNQRRQATS